FDASLNRENLRDWRKRLTARPHHLGSPYDKENAEFIASQLRSWGYETEIEEFEVLFPTPKLRLLEMTAPSPFTAALKEPALAEDSTSGLVAEQLPTYNAYSIDGDITGQLVYVNFGVPKDYETLAERGVDVKGRIVIARYGGAWRGIKPKVAAAWVGGRRGIGGREGDALPLLGARGGPVAPEDWRGALPVTYHLGPGPATVHLKVEFNWDLVPLYNVIGKMPGAERAHEWVLRGNHHDAWVCGADDPISGTVDVMEEARAIGELAKSGWKPKRTI